MTKKTAATSLRTFRTFLLMQQFQAREIGERIALARHEADGMTQETLSEALNVSQRSVQDYEAGVTIPWRHFHRLEEIFEKPLRWFLHGDAVDDSELEQFGALAVRFERIAARLEALLDVQEPQPHARER